MAARSEKRKMEAEKLMAEGRELLKTTFMRWSPDFLMAAMKFKQAADRYKGLRMKKEARDAFMQTYECEMAQRNHFQAGKMADQASKCVDDGNDEVEADLLKKAYDAYIEAMEWRVAMNTAKTCAQKWVFEVSVFGVLEGWEFGCGERERGREREREREREGLTTMTSRLLVKGTLGGCSIVW